MNIKCYFLLIAALSLSVEAQPYTPKDDDEVLERLPAQLFRSAAFREVKSLRKALNTSPNDWMLASRQAERFIDIAHSQSDPRYMGYAQAVLKPWWQQSDPPAKALILRAIIRQYEHDFGGALADLAQVLRLQPRNQQAWLMKATIETVQGNYREAIQSCRQLLRRASTVMAIVCQSVPSSLSGNADVSYRLLQQVLSVSPFSNPKTESWALTALGEIAWRKGLFDEADRHFQTALQVGVRDVYLLRIYADFLLQQSRPSEVITLLSSETGIDSLLLRLTLAEKALVSECFKAHVALLQARFDANRQRSSAMHKGDEARFSLDLLGDPQRALQLAEENWVSQRESADTYILLRAALSDNSNRTVSRVIQWLSEKRTSDVLIDEILSQKTGGDRHV